MGLTDIIIIAILAVIIGGAAFFIYRAKKSGRACIGCPDSKNCGKCDCGCGTNKADK